MALGGLSASKWTHLGHIEFNTWHPAPLCLANWSNIAKIAKDAKAVMSCVDGSRWSREGLSQAAEASVTALQHHGAHAWVSFKYLCYMYWTGASWVKVSHLVILQAKDWSTRLADQPSAVRNMETLVKVDDGPCSPGLAATHTLAC